METAGAILDEIRAHFARYPRPADFINRRHCEECEAHYQELLGVSADAIEYAHVENQGWDATCFLSPGGFRHYFPGLARIADAHRRDWLWVLAGRLGLHYTAAFSAEDRALMRRLLEHWWLSDDLDEHSRTEVGRVLEQHHSDI